MTFRSLFAGMTLALAAACAGSLAPPAQAAILVDQGSPYGGYYVGAGGDWGAFTSTLAAQPGGYTVGSISNAAQVAAADAIVVVHRNPFLPGATLTGDEITNLAGFLATGKRVLLIGEGSMWGVWNNSILAFASGGAAAFAGDTASGTATPTATSELTDGVASALLQGGRLVTGGDGEALFNLNFAQLWGGNLLTVFDGNIFQQYPAPAFRDNVAAWLGASEASAVSAPATLPLLLAGLASVARRGGARRASDRPTPRGAGRARRSARHRDLPTRLGGCSLAKARPFPAGLAGSFKSIVTTMGAQDLVAVYEAPDAPCC